jgi:hypothetical protein
MIIINARFVGPWQALKVSVGWFATRAQGITTPWMNEVATCKVLMC